MAEKLFALHAAHEVHVEALDALEVLGADVERDEAGLCPIARQGQSRRTA